MDSIWQYESGVYVADMISYDNIEIVNNFEVKISKSYKFDSFYLLGCYFGRLYLLEINSLKYTSYYELDDIEFIGN
jgi:hypothetical protein